MKYNIKWCEVSKTGETNGRKWTMTKMLLVDEAGKETADVTTFDPVINGQDIEGEIVQNGQYLNFKTANHTTKKPNMERVMEKKATMIGEAQHRKEESIERAQDRSAWMWARYGASEIVAHHPAFKFLAEETLLGKINELATEIYNSEPSKPF